MKMNKKETEEKTEKKFVENVNIDETNSLTLEKGCDSDKNKDDGGVDENEEKTKVLTEFQQKKLDEAKKELEAMEKEHSTKKYLVSISKEDFAELKNFINEKAKWKFTEVLGVEEVLKDFKKTKENLIYIKGVAVEAVYYYLSKVEGNGHNFSNDDFESIDSYLRILKEFSNIVEKIKKDSDKINEMKFVVAARQEGMEPDDSILKKMKEE